MQFFKQLFYIEHPNGKTSVDQATVVACIMLALILGGILWYRFS